MRWLALIFVVLPLAAQSSLYVCMTVTREYVVGAELPSSGLFLEDSKGQWRHAGFNHPFIFSLDYDVADPSIVYLAAGNGLIRASENGAKWKFLTGGDVTELRDVSVDRDGAIYFAHSHGIRVSRDRGATWQEIGGTLHRKFTAAVRADRGIVISGGEEGIFRSEDRGRTWHLAGAAGFQVTRIEQSTQDACEWAATTQNGGVFLSHGCAKTFESSGRIGVGTTLYDVAFDPHDANRIAVGGWGPGIAISEDGGRTWQSRNAGLPVPEIVSVIFDSNIRGRIYASVRDDGLYLSNDAGRNWSKQGLDGSMINRMKFIPKAAK